MLQTSLENMHFYSWKTKRTRKALESRQVIPPYLCMSHIYEYSSRMLFLQNLSEKEIVEALFCHCIYDKPLIRIDTAYIKTKEKLFSVLIWTSPIIYDIIW